MPDLPLSLGERPHDPAGCHMAGRPHLGPCGSGAVLVDAADLRTVLDQRMMHTHERPGVWDAENRPGLANTACVECAARARLREALPGGGRTEPMTKRRAETTVDLTPEADQGRSELEAMSFTTKALGQQRTMAKALVQIADGLYEMAKAHEALEFDADKIREAAYRAGREDAARAVESVFPTSTDAMRAFLARHQLSDTPSVGSVSVALLADVREAIR